MTSSGFLDFKSNFEISPIILVGGIAGNSQQVLPIVQLLNSDAFSSGLSSGLSDLFGTSDEYFAHFKAVPGGTLIDNEIAMYPFANQAVAANATIAQPLRLTLEMRAPARGIGGWSSKSSIMQALQASLYQHSALGGWYVVATPSYQLDNCLLRSLEDVSGGESEQVQHTWHWNFVKPLITQAEAAQSLNTLLSKINSGTQVIANADGTVTWSSPNNTQGAPATGVLGATDSGTVGRNPALTSLNSPPSFGSLIAP